MSSVIAACGGGGDSDSDSGSENIGTYVSGVFKSSDITGIESIDSNCSGNTRYFETDKTVVFGDSSLPNDDFKYAATLVHIGLLPMLSKFDMTEDDYYQSIDPVRYRDRDIVYNYINDQITNSTTLTEIETTMPDFARVFENMKFGYVVQEGDSQGLREYTDALNESNTPSTGATQSAIYVAEVAAQYYAGAIMNRIGRDDFVKIYNNVIELETQRNIDDYELTVSQANEFMSQYGNPNARKTYVCLDMEANGSRWGQGKAIGISFAPKSRASKHDVIKITKHELVHHLQHIVAGGSIPRWFSEGQANAFAGMSVATADSGYNPFAVDTAYEERTEYSGYPGSIYADYAKAYMHVQNEFGKENIFTVLRDVKEDTDGYRLGDAGSAPYELYTDVDRPKFVYYFQRHLDPIAVGTTDFGTEWLRDNRYAPIN
jgi:hypothetical protein